MWSESWATREPGEAVWSRHPRLQAEARDSGLGPGGCWLWAEQHVSMWRGCLVFPTPQL